MDINAAYLQAKGFNRTIYVIPPTFANDPTGLWKLRAAAYGLVDSGRLWYRTRDDALITDHRLTKSRYEHTLYFRKSGGKLRFVLGTQVDNYVYAGIEDEVRSFESFLQKRFRVGALDRREFEFLGCEILQDDDGTITLTQNTRTEEIDDSCLLTRKAEMPREPDRDANPKELRTYRSVIGKMLYIGRLCDPVMLYHASHMATKTNNLQTHHLNQLRSIVKLDKKRIPTIRFLPPKTGQQFTLEAISDASMLSASEGGGRGSFIITRRAGDITHPIYWCARKLHRVARSISTAELLAASDAASTIMYIQRLMLELSYHQDGTLLVDSRALMNLATSIREPAKPANKIDLTYLRKNHTQDRIKNIGWIPGYYNVADAMTKDNRTSASIILRSLREGIFPIHADTILRAAEPALQTKDLADHPHGTPKKGESGEKGGV